MRAALDLIGRPGSVWSTRLALKDKKQQIGRSGWTWSVDLRAPFGTQTASVAKLYQYDHEINRLAQEISSFWTC